MKRKKPSKVKESGDVVATNRAAAWALSQGMSLGEGRSQDTQTWGKEFLKCWTAQW